MQRVMLLFLLVGLLCSLGPNIALAEKTNAPEAPWLSERAVREFQRLLTQDPAFDEPVPDWWGAQLNLSYGAWWIGHPEHKGGPVRFKRTFELDNVPKLASLTVSADGDYSVWLNKEKLGGGKDHRFARQFQVGGKLRKGTNAITVQADRKEGGIGMLAMLFIPPKGGLVSDDAWQSALGAEGQWVPAVKQKLHSMGPGRERMLGWNVLYKKVKPVGLEIHPAVTVKTPLHLLDDDGKSAVCPHGKEKRPIRVVVDFGREVLGYVHIKGSTSEKVPFKIATGEFYEEAVARDRHHQNLRDSHTLPAGAFQWRDPKRRGFRYVVLDFQALEPSLNLDAVWVEYPYYPMEYRGNFLCSDPLLNRIWGVSAYTLRICMQSFYEDGVKRDTWPWMGDARVEALFNYPVFGDEYLARFTMDNLRGRGRPTVHLNEIPAYSAYWVLGLRDYWWQTGKLDYVRDHADEIESLLDFCLVDLNEQDLYDAKNAWRFIDWTRKRIIFTDPASRPTWTDDQIDYRGAMIAQHGLLYDAVMQGAKLLRLCGREKSAKKYEAIGARMKAAANKLLWDPNRGCYADALVEGKLSEKVTRQSNAVAILSGIAPSERYASILKNVFRNDAVPQVQTYYFSYYTLETRYQLGESQAVLDRIRKHWGALIVQGVTTLWERYDPTRRMHWMEMWLTSTSHAWGAAPLALFPKYILGVRQAAPGWAAVRLELNLHDLKWAQGVVPTPRGNISVWLKRDPDGEVTGRVRIPKGIRLDGKTSLIVETYEAQEPE